MNVNDDDNDGNNKKQNLGGGGVENINHSKCPLLSSLAAQLHVELERRDARIGKG